MVASWLLLIALAGEPVPQIVVPCKIASVHDGDTLTVDITIRATVRLLDCWAPEITGPEKADGLKSKAKLEELAGGKSGLLTIPLYETLGQSLTFSRVLGRLNIAGKDISEEMVAAGVATKTR